MNNTIKYLKQLQNFSHPEDSRNRKLIKSYELAKGLYNYGTIINAVDNIYEVYCYVVSNDNSIIVSSLLLKEFSNLNKALIYYQELANMMKENDIIFLFDKCKSENK